MWQKIEINEKNVSYRTVVTVVSGMGCSTGIQESSSQLVTFWTLSSLKRFFSEQMLVINRAMGVGWEWWNFSNWWTMDLCDLVAHQKLGI